MKIQKYGKKSIYLKALDKLRTKDYLIWDNGFAWCMGIKQDMERRGLLKS